VFEKINKKKLAGALLAGVITVTGATSAFAADQPTNSLQNVYQRQFHKIDITEMSTKIKSAIDSLVSAGTITQAQADAALKAYARGEGKGMFHAISRRNPMSELVTSGTITQAQADAIYNALKTVRESKKTIEVILKDLVTAGTITQAQSDAAFKCFTPKDREFIHMNIGGNPMSELVTSGTLTQTQLDAINKVIKTGMDSLVAAGTITQAQADAIEKARPSFEGKDLNIMKFRNNPLDELVTAGTITQAQADAINIAIKSAMNSLDK
jgi:competence protein ComGC